MKKLTTVSNYLTNEYLESALYMNYRALPSYIDGFKVSGRKCMYTVVKKGLKERAKVINFAGDVVSTSNYLHGNTSIEGTLVTLSQDFCGSNNIPILKGEGGFGTRFSRDASAPRYIYVKSTSFIESLFRKEDINSVETQEFEGKETEPIYYVPTLPLLLVNGCIGIGVGFKSEILARPVENIIKALKEKLNGKKIKSELFKPGWKGFEGTIDWDKENESWIIKGKAELNGRKLEITELPISWDLSSYLKKLKTLKEKGIVERFSDFSENDKFKFTLVLSKEESEKNLDSIFEDCGIVETIKEKLNTIDEKNAVVEFEKPEEIFQKYFEVKIKHLNVRIKNEIKRIKEEIEKQSELASFIDGVINDKINLKVKRKDLEEKLTKLKYTNIDFLVGHPLDSLTKEKVSSIKEKLKEKKEALKTMEKMKPENLWLQDIEELEKLLKKEKLL